MIEELLDLQAIVNEELDDLGIGSSPEKNSEASCVRKSCILPHVHD